LYRYLERFAQIGGFIKELSKDIHDKEISKAEEDEKENNNKSPLKYNFDDNKNWNFEEDQEPLFVDPNNKAYLKSDISQLSDEDKYKINCEAALAIYLYEVSKKVDSEFYKVMLRFVFAYRECINKYGWEKKAESNEIIQNEDNWDERETNMIIPASVEVIEKAKELRKKANGLEFSIVNNAEHAPEICNEFVTIFLQQRSKDVDLDKNESIDLTRNLCHWLFNEGYTCSKISMIKN
jgi:hypothetical protein